MRRWFSALLWPEEDFTTVRSTDVVVCSLCRGWVPAEAMHRRKRRGRFHVSSQCQECEKRYKFLSKSFA